MTYDSASQDPLQLDPTEAPNVSPPNFVERFASVPLVEAVLGAASQYYAGVKARSALLAAAIATTENAAAAVGRRCEATVRARYGQQLQYLDSLSCRGLDVLEERYPAALRRPEEIAADVTAFGRRKAAELERYGHEKIDRARAVLTTAAHKATHPVETLTAVRDALSQKADQTLNSVHELLDLWICSHCPNHDPSINGGPTPLTILARISNAVQKFRTAFPLQLSAETRYVKRVARGFYVQSRQALLDSLSPSDPPQTTQDHVIVAARHAFLGLSLLTQRPRRFYASLHASVAARFCAQPAVVEPPPSRSSSPPSPDPRPPSSTHNPSAESDDSFSTTSTT